MFLKIHLLKFLYLALFLDFNRVIWFSVVVLFDFVLDILDINTLLDERFIKTLSHLLAVDCATDSVHCFTEALQVYEVPYLDFCS